LCISLKATLRLNPNQLSSFCFTCCVLSDEIILAV
jgi:hypothetical protein